MEHVQKVKFSTDSLCVTREDKARHVHDKYKTILTGKILDVGADQCFLKNYLDENKSSYVGIGMNSDNLDINVNLESECIPFPDSTFDCVLCLDVLEHLENIHHTFNELCRVSKRYVIISLPNPWACLWKSQRTGDYKLDQHIKFYGLPVEKPSDRHRWFFSAEEAFRFIVNMANSNSMRIVQMDNEGVIEGGNIFWRSLKRIAFRIIFARGFNPKNLSITSIWTVLEKCKI